MPVHHIVLIKFTPGATPAQKEAWKSGITALASSVPQVKGIIHGKKIPHAKDGDWDDGVILVFDNHEDLKAYAVAQPHVDYVKATSEQTADKLIFDIES